MAYKKPQRGCNNHLGLTRVNIPMNYKWHLIWYQNNFLILHFPYTGIYNVNFYITNCISRDKKLQKGGLDFLDSLLHFLYCLHRQSVTAKSQFYLCLCFTEFVPLPDTFCYKIRNALNKRQHHICYTRASCYTILCQKYVSLDHYCSKSSLSEVWY